MCLYVTESVNTFAQKLKSILLYVASSYTQELSIYSVSTVQYELVCFSGGHFANPVMSQLKEWCL